MAMIILALVVAIAGLVCILAREAIAAALFKIQFPLLSAIFGKSYEMRAPKELQRYQRWVSIVGFFLIAFSVALAVRGA